MELAGHDLVKIGSCWLFDKDTLTGYRVKRAPGSPKTQIDGLIEAFRITRYNQDTPTISQTMPIPAGVMRKAMKYIEEYGNSREA